MPIQKNSYKPINWVYIEAAANLPEAHLQTESVWLHKWVFNLIEEHINTLQCIKLLLEICFEHLQFVSPYVFLCRLSGSQ